LGFASVLSTLERKPEVKGDTRPGDLFGLAVRQPFSVPRVGFRAALAF
jgi:hypothetical protein